MIFFDFNANCDRSKLDNEWQSLKTWIDVSGFEFLKLLISNVFNILQPLNILSISRTEFTFKLDKFRKVSFEQPWNIELIFETFSTLNCDKSRYSKDLQL